MSTMTVEDVNSVLRIVQEKLAEKAKRTGILLDVSSEASRQEDDWLYVVVTPSRHGIRAYDYVSTLSEVERELRERGMNHILIVPAIAD